ncbi:hypothetical protein V502_03845 [Pseudogymnoascus sp. VKM F-4520 (FW-2644)]|nr:hypothetical protein V502_03845 [Pseudogymnoascus sp. VKM F-4520 (FW-2644)]
MVPPRRPLLRVSTRALGCLFRGCTHVPQSTSYSYSANRRLYSSPATKPLRILFCGSDDVSIASLQALCDEQKRDPSSIASIDVLCRPGKPYGRGLRKIRDVPLKATAQSLGLRTHMRDTFTGWELPKVDGESINLIIAVSFGLFVPPRVLNSTEYDGLNLHLSLLPDLRGPSPVDYAILNGYKQTGVTLQTLSPEDFDHGKILLQAPISIPDPNNITRGALQDILVPISADLLIRGLREKVYLPQTTPVEPILPRSKILALAPKINTGNKRLLSKMTAEEIVRKERALGRVWVGTKLSDGSRKRVILEGLETVPMPAEMSDFYATHEDEMGIFKPFTILEDDGEKEGATIVPMMKTPDGNSIIIAAKGGSALLIRNATIDGSKKNTAAVALYGKSLEGDSDGSWFNGTGELIYWDAVSSIWDIRH